MIINAASSFIGILTLVGVKNRLKGDWSWIGHLKHYKAFVAAILFGVPTAVLMGIHLFPVQARGSFDKVYPRWLLAGNGLFLASAAAAIFFFWHHRQGSGKLRAGINPDTVDNHTTALLWVLCPLIILISMNLLVMGVAVAGFEFR
jgi:heme/copper-type cytochrome/quinol oxidase subunit 2